MFSHDHLSALRTRFQEDGVVFLPGVLDARALQLASACYEWTLNNPGPGAGPVLLGTPGTFYQDQANPDSYAAYRQFLRETPLADVAGEIFGCGNVWLMYEQIWLKDGADTRRTPWHQDLPYLPASGDHLMVMWANLDPVEKEYSLEFIRGSHRGPLYNPSAFNPDDEAANLFNPAEWPPIPAIEQARDEFPILSWAVQPGDVVAFHPAVLHGGAPTRAGVRRRTLSLRFFGDDAWVATRPHDGMANVDGLKHDDGGRHPLKKMAQAPDGAPFRHEDFPQLRPL
ncbi:MAG: phytanoyl-CoA dioxygenase family protein [Gammaproteobacteria bacterium]|nr:phytanoyl-CoA dioxygenase family protein [Gammaproteobacteria bacterium]